VISLGKFYYNKNVLILKLRQYWNETMCPAFDTYFVFNSEELSPSAFNSSMIIS
jgi:hypothetical protein